MGTGAVRKGALPHSLQLGLLMGANLLASIGGGKVLSAGEGVTGLVLLGSGSLLALLVGSALGLGLLVATRRFLSNWALVGLSLAAVFSSITLLALLWIDHLATSGILTIWDGGSKPLSQPEAWLFFFVLVLRCALWFAGRSLRSDLAASLRPSWLAWTEAAYFLGFIMGVLIGHVTIAGRGNVVSSLLLDVLLLSIVVLSDVCESWTVGAQLSSGRERPVGERMRNEWLSFWKLTAAFAASTIACQVVVLHVADVLAHTRRSAWPTWSDVTIATFYLGVALAAVFCAWSRPALEMGGQWVGRIVLRSGTQRVGVPFVLLITLSGVLTLAGIFGIMTSAQEGNVQAPWSAIGILSLAALASGAVLFETLVLALLGRIHAGGSGAVALAFGIVATAAAIALFLMMLGALRFSGWMVTTVIGFALTAWGVRGISPLNTSASRGGKTLEGNE